MEQQIKKLINEGKNYLEIAKVLGIHRTTVSKICKKLGLKPLVIVTKACTVCGRDMGENKKNHSKCNTCVTRLRRLRIKKKCVEYLGGKCERCGYDKHLAALTFHHLDPTVKEFTITTSKSSHNWPTIKNELDKCILLCSNCHNIEHSKYDDENLLKHL